MQLLPGLDPHMLSMLGFCYRTFILFFIQRDTNTQMNAYIDVFFNANTLIRGGWSDE